MDSMVRAWGGRLASWTRGGLAGLLVAGPLAAQGNVLALEDDGSGSLLIFGDAQGNRLLFLEEYGENDVVIRGLDGTTVNGQSEIRRVIATRVVLDLRGGDDYVRFAKFEQGGCCGFEIVFLGGEGDDTLRLGDEEASVTNAFVDLGPGNDLFHAGEDGGVRDLTLLGGEGNDVVRGQYPGVRGATRLDLGPGDDLVELHDPFTGTGDALAIDGGPGADTVRIDYLGLRGSLVVTTGDDEDLVEILQVANGAGGPLIVDSGGGADRIRILGDAEVVGGISVQAGDEADLVELDGLAVAHSFMISLGTGDDRLRVSGSAFEAPVPAVFDGAEGTDRYVDLGGNHFAVTPDVRHFEGPLSRHLFPAPLTVSTVLAGRVVEPSGDAVAGAAVSILELGRTATSEADGSFRIEAKELPLERLQLAAAATVRGRRMAAIDAFRPLPDRTVEIGDVQLLPTHATGLVFGDDLLAVEQFEQRLRELGNDPLDVVVERFLPVDLAPYEVVWHVAWTAPLTAGESDRLAAFVRSGGGLHLAGEGNLVQAAHESLVNRLIVDPDVHILSYTGSSFPIEYNPDVTGALARWPNVLGAVGSFYGGRFISGIQPENAFIVGAEDRAFAGAWSSLDLVGGRGRLTLGLITLTLSSPYNLAAVENLQAFLRWEPDGFTTR